MAMIIGQALGYDLIKLRELATGALLHDIGLLQLPPHLFRTSIPLSGEHLATFHHHPRLGAIAIEAQREFSQAVRRIAAEHHVTLDGQGYPPETSASSTAEESRIVMIADRYDELLTGFGGGCNLCLLTRQFNIGSKRENSDDSTWASYPNSSNWLASTPSTVSWSSIRVNEG